MEDAECNLITCKLPKKILSMEAQNAHKILLNKLFNAHKKKKTSAITGTIGACNITVSLSLDSGARVSGSHKVSCKSEFFEI